MLSVLRYFNEWNVPVKVVFKLPSRTLTISGFVLADARGCGVRGLGVWAAEDICREKSRFHGYLTPWQHRNSGLSGSKRSNFNWSF